MKLNNKGFAVSTMLYGLTIMAILLVLLIMSSISSNRINTKKVVKQVEKELNRFTQSKATITSNNPNSPEEYFVTDENEGWYKIEVWGSPTGYSNITTHLKSGTEVYFYVGKSSTTTKNTIACLNNDGRNSCTKTNKKILLDSNDNTIEPYATQQIQKYNGTTFITINNNIYLRNNIYTNSSFKNITNTQNISTGKAKITLISKKGPTENPGLILNPNTTSPGNFYIYEETSGNALTAIDEKSVEARPFAGVKSQQWKIEIIPSTNYYSIINVDNNKSLTTHTTGGYTDKIFLSNHTGFDINNNSEKWSISSGSNNIKTAITTTETLIQEFITSASTTCPKTPTINYCIGKKVTYNVINDENGTKRYTCNFSPTFYGELSLNTSCTNFKFLNADI